MGASPWDSDSRVKDSRRGKIVNIWKTDDVGTLSEDTSCLIPFSHYSLPNFRDKTLCQEAQCIVEQWYFLKLENESMGLLKDCRQSFHSGADIKDKHGSVHR